MTNAATNADNNHDKKRTDILDAAAAVFWERGFTSGTTKEIASRVGLSQPTIYHYVGSKSALLEHIANEVHQRVVAALEEPRSRRDDPVEQLSMIVRSLTRFIAEQKEMFGVFWQEQRQLSDDVRTRARKDQRDLLHEIEVAVAAIQQDGLLAPDRPPAVVASAILGMVVWLHQWYRPEGEADPDEIALTFLEMLGLA